MPPLLPLARTYVILTAGRVAWPGVMALVWAGPGVWFWLLQAERDGRADQFEGTALDRGGGGELLDFLAADADDLAGEGGQVAEQVLVAADGQLVAVVLTGVLGACLC